MSRHAIAPGAALHDPVRCTELGQTLVLHTGEQIAPNVRRLAEGVAADPRNQIVVVDLPAESPAAVWDGVSALLTGRVGSFRLVFARPARDTTTVAVATDLARGTGRSILTHDGPFVPVGHNGLFVPASAGRGWVRIGPDAGVTTESARYPRPPWDVPPGDLACTVDGLRVEPLPGGLWCRPATGTEAGDDGFRRTLVACLVPRDEQPTVVLGAPGAPPLSLSTLTAVWRHLPPTVRETARFVTVGDLGGPASLTGDLSIASALSDLLDRPVVVYSGLPTPRPADVDGSGPVLPRTVRRDGGPGWFPFHEGVVGRPGGESGRLVGVRAPFSGIDAVAPGCFSFESDVVLEVVPAGLWVRPAQDWTRGEEVLAAPADPEQLNLIYEAGTPAATRRYRTAAEEVVVRLPLSARSRVTLTSAAELGTALPVGDPPAGDAPAERPAVRGPAAPPPAIRPTTTVFGLEPPAVTTADVVTTEGGPVAEPAAAALAGAVKAPQADLPGPGTEMPQVAAAVPEPARPAARPQRVPGRSASAVPPTAALTDERSWMRRAFATQYNIDAGTVSAMVSQTPGLRSGSSLDEVVLDLVAVRLFLKGDRDTLQRTVHQARKGPHVPLARCVAAGLDRLPSYRGAAHLVVPGAAHAAAVYRSLPLVTEWAFVDARSGPLSAAEGDLEVRIWSSTGRRTALLEPGGTDDRVVFGPGTAFRVLGVSDGPTPVVDLRETWDDDGRPHPLDEVARSGLARAAERWAAAPETGGPGGKFLPGLVHEGVTA